MMDVLMKLKIPLDKQAHLWWGAAMASTLTVYGVWPLYAFLAAVAIGAAKEVIDPYVGGHRDLWDAAITGIGAAVVLPKLLLPVLLDFL